MHMIIIGHRGAKGLAPENTLASFKKALEHSVDEIEFDVRVTGDGIPVITHDGWASDASGNKLQVSELTYEDLKRHKPDLITLKEAFDFIGGRVPMLVEVKPSEPVRPIVKIIRAYLKAGTLTERDLLLGSFSQRTLRELHAELPQIEKVVIERWSGVKARLRARQVNTKRLNMKRLWLWSGFLYGMHRSGYKVTPYTVNSPRQAQKWQPYLFGVITDFPDLFEK